MLSHSLIGVIALAIGPAFIFPPAKAADPADPVIRQLLEDIKTQVTGTRNDMAGLKERVNSIDRQLDDVRAAMVTTTEHGQLKRQLEQLKTDVDTLRAQVNNQAVTARSSPLGAGAPGMARPAAVGVLRVTNNNFVPMDVLVNGFTHQVPANAITDIDVPSGAFSYRVIGSNMIATRSHVMPAGRLFGIAINP